MPPRMRRSRRRTDVRPGAAPGTIVVDKKSAKPTVGVVQYSPTEIKLFEGIACAQIPEPKRDTVTWINVVGLGDKKIIRTIADRFDIHDLAVEDVVNTHQRPKVEDFGDHLYVVLRMPSNNGRIELEQVSIFIGKYYVLTWQERPGDCFAPVRERLKSSNRMIRRQANDFLAYALIDAIIDPYFPILTEYGDALDEIEDRLTASNAAFSIVHELHRFRSDIRSLRRTAWAHRDVIRSLISHEGELLTDPTRLHLRDVADHTLQLEELLESSRDSCSDLQDLYMSSVSMRMNEVIKVLTIIATIFMPLSFIAGLYGMNFSSSVSPWNMPETQWYWGYPLALLIMSTVAGAMVAYFYHQGWIGGWPSKRHRADPTPNADASSKS